MMVSTGHAGKRDALFKLPYDTVRDFPAFPASQASRILLVVCRRSGVKTVKELIALAKSKPGEFNFSSAGIGRGTADQRGDVQACRRHQATHAPYKGAPEALNEVMAGRVQFCFSPILVATGQVKRASTSRSGKHRARSPMFRRRPDGRRSCYAGLPVRSTVTWLLVCQPNSAAARQYAQSSEIVQHPQPAGHEGTAADAGRDTRPDHARGVRRFIRAEVQRFAKVLIAAGARIN